jgi:hypothetical protein
VASTIDSPSGGTLIGIMPGEGRLVGKPEGAATAPVNITGEVRCER